MSDNLILVLCLLRQGCLRHSTRQGSLDHQIGGPWLPPPSVYQPAGLSCSTTDLQCFRINRCRSHLFVVVRPTEGKDTTLRLGKEKSFDWHFVVSRRMRFARECYGQDMRAMLIATGAHPMTALWRHFDWIVDFMCYSVYYNARRTCVKASW